MSSIPRFHDFRDEYLKEKYPNEEGGRRYQLQSMYGKAKVIR
jgi:hypothetical protein